MSTAAAVPAFTRLEAAARVALFEAAGAEVDPIVRTYSDGGFATFPMHSHVARATR